MKIYKINNSSGKTKHNRRKAIEHHKRKKINIGLRNSKKDRKDQHAQEDISPTIIQKNQKNIQAKFSFLPLLDDEESSPSLSIKSFSALQFYYLVWSWLAFSYRVTLMLSNTFIWLRSLAISSLAWLIFWISFLIFCMSSRSFTRSASLWTLPFFRRFELLLVLLDIFTSSAKNLSTSCQSNG